MWIQHTKHTARYVIKLLGMLSKQVVFFKLSIKTVSFNSQHALGIEVLLAECYLLQDLFAKIDLNLYSNSNINPRTNWNHYPPLRSLQLIDGSYLSPHVAMQGLRTLAQVFYLNTCLKTCPTTSMAVPSFISTLWIFTWSDIYSMNLHYFRIGCSVCDILQQELQPSL